MTKTVKALIEKILAAQTENELYQISGDIDRLYDREKIKWDEHELLYKIIRKFLETTC